MCWSISINCFFFVEPMSCKIIYASVGPSGEEMLIRIAKFVEQWSDADDADKT